MSRLKAKEKDATTHTAQACCMGQIPSDPFWKHMCVCVCVCLFVSPLSFALACVSSGCAHFRESGPVFFVLFVLNLSTVLFVKETSETRGKKDAKREAHSH